MQHTLMYLLLSSHNMKVLKFDFKNLTRRTQ